MRVDNDQSHFGVLSVIVGGISLFLWLIPMAGVVASITAVYIGVKGLDSEQSGLAIIGIVFGIISCILTILRSGLVYGYV